MNALYENVNGQPELWFSGRDIERVLHWFKVTGFKPYFYGADKQGKILDVFDRPVKRIETRLPGHVRNARKKYKYHDEASILFPLRYIIDMKIYCGFSRLPDGNLSPADELLDVPPKLSLFDIEVESPPEIMSRPETPIYPIVTMQFSSNYFGELYIFALDFNVTGEKVKPPEGTNPDECITIPVTFDHPRLKEPTTLHPIVLKYSDERVMLSDVCKWFNLQEFDAAGGYNSDTYDFPYLIERCKLLNNQAKSLAFNIKKSKGKWEIPQGVNNRLELPLIPYKLLSPVGTVRSSLRTDRNGKKKWSVYIKGIQVIDIYKLYQKWSGGRQPLVKGRPFGATYDFHSVMEYECGFFYNDLGDKIKESRAKKPYDLIRYCCGDAYALRLLEEKKKIVGYFERFRRNVGVMLEQARHNSKLGEMRILRLSDKPIPSRTWREKSKVKGAIVLLPKTKGIVENVVVVDIKSLYPTLMMIYNLSPEVIDRHGAIKVGPVEGGETYRFTKSHEGIIPRAVKFDSDLREVYRERGKKLRDGSDEWEANKQLEVLHKFMACSYYGLTGYEGFFLYSDAIRKCITFLGREALNEIARESESLGYPVYYGDTDSLFIKLSGSKFREGYVVESIINQVLTRISRRRRSKHTLTCKFEHFCKRIIFVPMIQKKDGEIVAAKKRYAYIDENDELQITGLALRRSTTPGSARVRILEWLELVLKDNDVKGAIKLVRDFWDNFQSMPLNMIGLPRSVKKDKYTRTKKDGTVVDADNAWVSGVEYMYRVHGKIFREDKKPMLIYMDKEAMLAAGFDEDSATGEACITERDESLPDEITPFIHWDLMREKVITAYFKQLFDAIDIPWNEVILGQAQTTIDNGKNAEIKMRKPKRQPKKKNTKRKMTKAEELSEHASHGGFTALTAFVPHKDYWKEAKENNN